MTRKKRRILIAVGILFGLIVIGAASVALINLTVERGARGRIFTDPEQVPQTTVALVLGAKVWPNGQLSAMLEDRVLSAVRLYEEGRVQKLLMSGDNSESHYDEVTAMRDYAINKGVPPDDVIRDFAGFRTYDSIYRARDLWEQQKLIIVSQRFHLARSVFTARGLGLDAYGFVADRRRYHSASITRSRVREVFARTAAWLDVKVLRRKPHFLGEKEDLSGEKQEAAQRAKGSR